jgi:hypothetical protein
MLLDPSDDSRQRRATLDDFVDQKRCGVIRGGPQSETVGAYKDGDGLGSVVLLAAALGLLLSGTDLLEANDVL